MRWLAPNDRRKAGTLRAAGALLLAGCFVASSSAIGEEVLNVVTWSGAYGQSQEVAYFAPFTKESGIKINRETYDGSLAGIKAKIAEVDVADVAPSVLDALCREGVLEKVDKAALPASAAGQSADEDFLAGGLADCGVASVAWATAIAFDRQAFGKAQPSQIADMLDVKRFPGKRALPNGPRYTLELALLADGVAPEAVYTELGTPQGVDRAFAALDKIKPEILWWENPQDAVTWLAQRKASMAASYSGRIFRAALGARQRLEVLWDGQIYDLDLWAIPSEAKNKEAAKRFLVFASTPANMAAQAALIAYGPMRKSAIDLVGKHPEVDIEVKPYLPTAPDNFKKALRFNEAWWNVHGAELQERFKTWRTQTSAAVEEKAAEPGAAPGQKAASGKHKPADKKQKPAAAQAERPATAPGQKQEPGAEDAPEPPTGEAQKPVDGSGAPAEDPSPSDPR